MYTICKQFTFSASHHLEGLPADHPCSRDHGHNYVVEVELQADRLDDVHFVVDYRRLDFFKKFLDELVDHRNLNNYIDVTTAERLANYFYHWCHNVWPEVVAVRVSETPKTWAEYRPQKGETMAQNSCAGKPMKEKPPKKKKGGKKKEK